MQEGTALETSVIKRTLNSWKEISAYLGTGVRTAQRWEQDLYLPVRRPRGTRRSAVVAIPVELDDWLRKAPIRASSTYGKRRVRCSKECDELLQDSIGLLIRLQSQAYTLDADHMAILHQVLDNLYALQERSSLKKAIARNFHSKAATPDLCIRKLS